MDLPADIANQALDAIGAGFSIGDMTEGSDFAQITLRAYGQCMRQLLRAARWAFARKQVRLVLLADATGQTPNVGTLVQKPWRFCYLYPTDCMTVRFIPWSRYDVYVPAPPGNIALPPEPLTTGPQNAGNYGRELRPARFLVGTDPNYPSAPGQIYWETQGQSPIGSTVIMTNVQYAEAVYTAFIPYPSLWDSLFRAALVAYLASEIALPVWSKKKDPKFGLALRTQQIAIVRQKIIEARLIDGNESTTSSDIPVDWMQARRVGGGWGGLGGWDRDGGIGAGIFGEGYCSCGFADGSAY